MHSVIAYPAPTPIPAAVATLSTLIVKVLDSNDSSLQLGVDESYVLNVSANGPSLSISFLFCFPL